MAAALNAPVRWLKLPAVIAPTAFALDRLLAAVGVYWQTLHLVGEADWHVGVSCEKAVRELGYAPAVELAEGMQQAVRGASTLDGLRRRTPHDVACCLLDAVAARREAPAHAAPGRARTIESLIVVISLRCHRLPMTAPRLDGFFYAKTSSPKIAYLAADENFLKAIFTPFTIFLRPSAVAWSIGRSCSCRGSCRPSLAQFSLS